MKSKLQGRSSHNPDLMPVSPSSLYRKFTTSSLAGQFILCKSEDFIPNGWSRCDLGSWILGTEQNLPVVLFEHRETGLHGCLLGHAIDPKAGHFVFGPQSPTHIPDLNGFDCVESWLGSLTGRFAAVVFSASDSRIYLDAAGGLSCVWCPVMDICASSPMLIPYGNDTEDDTELIDALCIPESDKFFAFGLTPRHNIYRLLPNHYLDLNYWKARRHWPIYPIPVSTPAHVIDELYTYLTGTIEAVCKEGKAYLSLTAGRDSRMLLGCAQGFLNGIEFFTWDMPDSTAKIDIRVAKKLANRFGLSHKVFPFSESHPIDKEEWLYRTGCATGEVRGLSLATTVKQMDRQRFYLPGLASEVGRCFYWKKEDIDKPALNAEQIVARLSLPPSRKIIECGRRWLDDLPLSDRPNVLDFLYIEQRLGCWAGVTAYGDADGPCRLPPFSNREIFTMLQGLPYAYRMNQELASDLILKAWPDLLTASKFNSEGGLRRSLKKRLERTSFLWRFSGIL